MSDYGLEVRDSEGNIIIDSSTFTVRQVAKKFISSNDLLLKTGKTSSTRAVDFPWAESKYGMLVSITQVGTPVLPPTSSKSKLKNIVLEAGPLVVGKNSVDNWLLSTPRMPVATALDGAVRLSPPVNSFTANVWLSLYVVV